MLSLVGADFALERLHWALLGTERLVIPALDGRETQEGPLPADRMPPFFGRQFFELMLQFASGGRRRQKRSDDAEPKMGPALMRPEDLSFFFHAMPLF